MVAAPATPEIGGWGDGSASENKSEHPLEDGKASIDAMSDEECPEQICSLNNN